MRKSLWPLALCPQFDKSNNVLDISYANFLLDTVTPYVGHKQCSIWKRDGGKGQFQEYTPPLYTNLLTDGFFAEALAIPWISMTLGCPGATALFQENSTSFKLLTFQFYLKKLFLDHEILRNKHKNKNTATLHCLIVPDNEALFSSVPEYFNVGLSKRGGKLKIFSTP